jgi:hypothetical protein
MMVHRLFAYSGEYYFQQVCDYVGDRRTGEAGRAFPIGHGMVGLAMRTNSCFSLIRRAENRNLFKYTDIYARKLKGDVKSFLVVPIPSLNKASVLCFYFDSTETELVMNKNFRELVYSSLIYFVKYIDGVNAERREISTPVEWKSDDEATLKEKGILNCTKEVSNYWRREDLKMSSNRLIDIYAKW